MFIEIIPRQVEFLDKFHAIFGIEYYDVERESLINSLANIVGVEKVDGSRYNANAVSVLITGYSVMDMINIYVKCCEALEKLRREITYDVALGEQLLKDVDLFNEGKTSDVDG